MPITFDPGKRNKVLRERGLDFSDAKDVFVGETFSAEDDRRDYGETRIITVGYLRNRMVVIGWTPRGADRHVFKMGRPMTASKRSIGSDLAKVDAYENTAADYDELPELDDAFFDKAVRHRNGVPLRGRPPIGDRPKKQVTLRLDQDVIDHFRQRGSGWHSMINAVLRKAMSA